AEPARGHDAQGGVIAVVGDVHPRLQRSLKDGDFVPAFDFAAINDDSGHSSICEMCDVRGEILKNAWRGPFSASHIAHPASHTFSSTSSDGVRVSPAYCPATGSGFDDGFSRRMYSSA